MRRILSIGLAALVAISFMAFAASSASAQDKGYVVFKGYVMAGLGMMTETPAVGDSSSYFNAESQGQIEARGGMDNVTARFRLRVREDGKDLKAVRHRVTWKATDALKIDFEGQSFGQAYTLNAYSAYSIGHFGDGHTIGDLTHNRMGVGVNWGGIDATFSAGALQFGAAVIDSCRPSCAGADTETSTIIPHFFGKFGAIRVSAMLPMSSGVQSADADAGTEAVDKTGSEMDVQVRFKTGGMDLSFGYSAGAEETSNPGETVTQDYSGMGLGGKIGAIHFHYMINTKDEVSETTELALAYMIPLTKKATLAIGYALRGVTPEGGDESTRSQLIFTGKTGW